MSAGIDWVHWRRMERLELGDAVCLLLRIDPGSWLGRYVDRTNPSSDFSDGQRELHKRANNVWEVAWASYHAGNLRMRAGMGGASVSMSDWLGWARDKQFEIPSELSDLIPTDDAPAPTPRSTWPWGDHETELLRHLSAAAERFWKRYDPEDESTAPTSAQVTQWLKDRNVPDRVAEVMAQILRADGLRPGPRK